MTHSTLFTSSSLRFWPLVRQITMCLSVVFGALWLVGCCDPDAHIIIQNNYAIPIVVHHLSNPARNMPDEILDTLPPGKRSETAHNPQLDGDIDNLQIEDKQGHVLTRLSSTGKNVVCKQQSPEYIWQITVGP